MVVAEFKVNRRMIIESTMKALAIVKDLDVIEELRSGLSLCGKVLAVGQFQLEGTPEAFHGRIVIAVAGPPHRSDHCGLL